MVTNILYVGAYYLWVLSVELALLPFWHLAFCGGSYIFGTFVHPCLDRFCNCLFLREN